MGNRKTDRLMVWLEIIALGAVLVLGGALIWFAKNSGVVGNAPPAPAAPAAPVFQATVPPSSTATLNLAGIKATLDQSEIDTQAAAAQTPTYPILTSTPDLSPGATPDFGDIPHRNAGAGIIVEGPDPTFAHQGYAILNSWVETDFQRSVYVDAGGTGSPPNTIPAQGMVLVVTNGDANNPRQILTPFQDGPMAVIDVQGTELLLSSYYHHLPFVFSVGTGQPLTPITSSIGANFNGTAISAPNYIWFNSILKVNGLGSSPATLWFVGSTIQFAVNGTNNTLSVPNSFVTFSPTATQATTTFNAAAGCWETTVPLSYSGNVFLSGLAYQVPTGGLPGGINPVTWSGQFASDTPGLTVDWQWAAAVYTQFRGNSDDLGVKPIDGDKLNPYSNSDHAGTPESFKPFVIGGARGGGGSNYTGSYSGTGHVTP